MNRIEQIAIEHECIRLIYLYAQRLDAYDFDGFTALWADDGTWVALKGPITGRAAIRKYVGDRDTTQIMRHVVSNPVVDVLDAEHARGRSYYTVETHIQHKQEVAALEPIHVETQLLGHDDKRLHVFMTMRHSRTGVVLATGEQMLLHVDQKASKACPAEAPILAKLAEIASGQKALARPVAAGRSIAGVPGGQ